MIIRWAFREFFFLLFMFFVSDVGAVVGFVEFGRNGTWGTLIQTGNTYFVLLTNIFGNGWGFPPPL